jgi:hypothetical protein
MLYELTQEKITMNNQATSKYPALCKLAELMERNPDAVRRAFAALGPTQRANLRGS